MCWYQVLNVTMVTGQLTTQYLNTDFNIKLKLKSLAALAFVPINEVKLVFGVLAHSFSDEEKFNEILTYILKV